jgi:hypothetical protein
MSIPPIPSSSTPTKPELEKVAAQMQPKELKAFQSGKIRIVKDKMTGQWAKIKNYKFLEARGPMLTFGVVFLVISTFLFVSVQTNAFGMGPISSQTRVITGNYPFNNECWKVGQASASLTMHLDARANVTARYNVTQGGLSYIKTVSFTNVSEAEIVLEGMSMTVVAESILTVNFTVIGTESVFTSTYETTYVKLLPQDIGDTWIGPLLLLALVWFSGAFIWTGAKGRDPIKVASTKLKD